MPTVPLNPDVHRRILEMVAQGHSHRRIAEELHVGVGTVSEYRRRPLVAAPSDGPEKNEMTADSWTIMLPRTRISTLEQLIEHCKVDLSVWEVERFIVNKWEVGMKPPATTDYMEGKGGRETPAWVRYDDKPIIEPLFQVKAFLRKKHAIVAARHEIESLKELAKRDAPQPVKPGASCLNSGNMLEINIPDAHFGKLAWAVETGGSNYDTKIAREVFMRAVETLLLRVSAYTFDEILFVVGNDLLNSDDAEGRTTKGTVVTTDARYQKTFSVVRTVMVECVERFRQLAKVKVMMVPGNHDSLSVWHLGDSLECYFHKYSDVEIDNAPRYRKYYRFGSVMLMFTHGDKAKRTEYPLLMATEEPEMFGATRFREAHTGHTHMTKLDEQHGVRVRVLPALCAADDWLAENGFVGNQRNAEAYIWNKAEGLTGMAIYSEREEGRR